MGKDPMDTYTSSINLYSFIIFEAKRAILFPPSPDIMVFCVMYVTYLMLVFHF